MNSGFYRIILTKTAFVNVRLSPNLVDENVSFTLKSGDLLEVLSPEAAIKGGFTWARIRVDGKVGFIALQNHLKFEEVGEKIDTFNYICNLPENSFSRPHKMFAKWLGRATEHIQLQRGLGNFKSVKGEYGSNCIWEGFYVDNNFIYRTTDTSPFEAGQIYQAARKDTTLDNPQIGVKWLPRQMAIGEEFLIDMIAHWRLSENGLFVQHKEAVPFGHWIKLEAIHDHYVLPSGKVIDNVAEFYLYFKNSSGIVPFEKHFYSSGHGLVEWQSLDHPDRHSWFESLDALGLGNLVPLKLSWWNESNVESPTNIEILDVDNAPPNVEYLPLNFTNKIFAGDPIKEVEVRPKIYQATPLGWSIYAEPSFGSQACSILNIPNKDGWKLEPAQTKMYAGLVNRQKFLEKGIYKINLDVDISSIPVASRPNYAFGLFYSINGEVFDPDSHGVRFNAADHSGKLHYYIELKSKINFDFIGFVVKNAWAEISGHLNIHYFDIEKVDEAEDGLLLSTLWTVDEEETHWTDLLSSEQNDLLESLNDGTYVDKLHDLIFKLVDIIESKIPSGVI